ncbi:MAG: hypothetical protein K8R87_09195 [Verrucomicrobia bacterium]|nr:hypothetical protein [Verrucomicrobiota bacterium]
MQHMSAAFSPQTLLAVPLLGSIQAGRPTQETQRPDACINVDAESLRLPKGSRTFALKVQGDSMTNAGILNGDVVILEFRTPNNGEIVAALIDGECTLKRYVVQRGRPFLRAENPNYPALIPAHELAIQGVQVALLRLAPRP